MNSIGVVQILKRRDPHGSGSFGALNAPKNRFIATATGELKAPRIKRTTKAQAVAVSVVNRRHNRTVLPALERVIRVVRSTKSADRREIDFYRTVIRDKARRFPRAASGRDLTMHASSRPSVRCTPVVGQRGISLQSRCPPTLADGRSS